jgi:hypothetical protein
MFWFIVISIVVIVIVVKIFKNAKAKEAAIEELKNSGTTLGAKLIKNAMEEKGYKGYTDYIDYYGDGQAYGTISAGSVWIKYSLYLRPLDSTWNNYKYGSVIMSDFNIQNPQKCILVYVNKYDYDKDPTGCDTALKIAEGFLKKLDESE